MKLFKVFLTILIKIKSTRINQNNMCFIKIYFY